MLKLIIIAICLSAKATEASPILTEEGKVCDSTQCKAAVEIIKSLINNTIDPCNDFYNYVCGNWEANYPLPDTEDVWNFERMVERNAELEVKEILEEDEDEADSTPLKYEKWWYEACMDLDQIEEDGLKLLEETLDYFGGWPIAMNSSDWTDDEHDWQGIHEYYSTFKDLSSVFDIVVAADERNASLNVVGLNKPTESLYDLLLRSGNEESVGMRYSEFARKVVLALVEYANKSISEDDVAKDVEDLLAFEKGLRLIKISANESEDIEPSRTYMTIKDLQEFYNGGGAMNPTAKIDWLRVFSVMFNDLDNITITNSEDIGIEDILYLRKLAHLLDETPNRVLVNYVHWKFVAASIKYTNKEMRDLYSQVMIKSDEPDSVPERWEECKADMKLGVGYRYEYIKRHLSEDTRKMATDVASDMRGEMLDEVERANWLDDNAKEETMIKLHALKWHVGVSNFYLRQDFIEHIYDGMMITSNYFENVQNAREYFTDRNLKRLRHHRANHKFVRVDPLEAKTLYDPSRNYLVISAAQLSVPLLHSTLPPSVNYGYIAPTIGQLMSRTMEKEGLNTNTYMPPWSTYLGDTYKSYEPKLDCLTKQYFNYSVGPSTVDENMYDAIGLKVAYNAFQNSLSTENAEKLPDLEEFGDDQLFFISYALKYCQSASDKYLSEHSPTFSTPNEYRVIGTLVNLKDFANAFSCPLNSPMNPEAKCII